MKAIEFKEVEKSFQDGDQVVKALKETTMSIDKGNLLQSSVLLVQEKVPFDFSRRIADT